MLRAAIVTLWCDVAEAAVAVDNPLIQSIDDNEWYELQVQQLAPGLASLYMGQVAGVAGPNAYLVILNLDDGLKYKLSAYGVPPNVEFEIDPNPTVEPETSTTVYAGSTPYHLDLVNDPTPTTQLTPI